MSKITLNSNLGEIVEKYPELGEILREEYGLHCVGCMAASFDSLEQGAKAHGFDDGEIKKMVERLNQVFKKKRRKK
ncbi:MAG: DUF1858 domain-containing protein [Candidatus Beckwithbacteria bacterium]